MEHGSVGLGNVCDRTTTKLVMCRNTSEDKQTNDKEDANEEVATATAPIGKEG